MEAGSIPEIKIPRKHLEALNQIVANSLRFESVDEYVRFLLRAVVDSRQATQFLNETKPSTHG